MNIIQKSTDYFKNNWVVEANGSKIIALVMLSGYLLFKATVKIINYVKDNYPETLLEGYDHLHNLIGTLDTNIGFSNWIILILLVIFWLDSFFTIENVNRRRSISRIEDCDYEYINVLFRQIKINRMQQIIWHFKVVGCLCIFGLLIYIFDSDYYALIIQFLSGFLLLGIMPLMLYSKVYSAYWKFKRYSESQNVSLGKYASLKAIITSAIYIPSLAPIIYILDMLPGIRSINKTVSFVFFFGFLVIWFCFLYHIMSWIFMKFDKPMEIWINTTNNTQADKYNLNP